MRGPAPGKADATWARTYRTHGRFVQAAIDAERRRNPEFVLTDAIAATPEWAAALDRAMSGLARIVASA